MAAQSKGIRTGAVAAHSRDLPVSSFRLSVATTRTDLRIYSVHFLSLEGC